MGKKIFSIIIVFVILIASLITYQINKNKRVNLFNKDNILAIYVDGVESATIPSQTSGYEFDKAVCDNGATLDWDYKNWALDLSFTSKLKCSLYFKNSFKLRGTATNILNQLSENNNSIDVIDKGWSNTFAYDGTVDNNLRYVGTDPKNYIQFNGELWRIIGVMNNVENSSGQTQSLLKIVRNDYIGKYSWDSSDSYNSKNGINQWGPSTYDDGTYYEGADLMRELNTDYLGNITVGTDGKWYNGNNNIKTADMPTNLLSSNSQSMIESVVWYFGVPGNVDGTYSSSEERRLTPRAMYTKERTSTTIKTCSGSYASYCTDNVVRTDKWTGKVALIYLSDFGFSTSGGATDNRDACLDISIANNVSMSIDGWNNHPDCFENSWMIDLDREWSLIPSAFTYDEVTNFYKDDNILTSVGYSRSGSYQAYRVRPTIYLKSSISITSGSGSIVDPYILSNTSTT